MWNCHSEDKNSENKHGDNCHSEDQYSEDRHSEDEHSETCHNKDKHSITIGILIPSTTKYINVPDLENLSLMSIALPSISVTMETEYHYTVYVAIEKDDYLECPRCNY